MPQAALSLGALAAAAVPVAWLVPNHYYPWPSAWSDGLAIALLGLAALTLPEHGRVPRAWLAAAAVAAVSVGVQWRSGRILFAGDALMVLLYLSCFVLALAAGSGLTGEVDGSRRQHFLVAIATGILASALVSAGIALAQWAGEPVLGIYGAELRPGARPYANVAQANHFAALSFLGLCAAAQLRELGRLRATGYWVAALLLLWSMVMSGSRTSWGQLAALLLMVLILRRSVPTRLGASGAVALLLLFALGTWLWPMANALTLLSGVRADTAGLHGAGGRELLWPAMLDAIAREPLGGYGWQQAFRAQLAVAPDHPPIGRHFEHTHNLLLDLIVWAGLPAALTIIALASIALLRKLRALRDARALWPMCMVLGALVHSMVEFPLEFAYFLIPVGLALGSVHALSPDGRAMLLPGWTLRIAGAALLLVLALIAVDYLEAEQNQRTLRLESARIGVQRLETPTAQLRVLDQQQAFLEFARTEARPGMTAAEVDWMRRVAERFGYPPVMFRYALAAALNGRPEQAARTLDSLCRIHPRERCDEGRDAWSTLQQRYPQLRSIPWPREPAAGAGDRAAASANETASNNGAH